MKNASLLSNNNLKNNKTSKEQTTTKIKQAFCLKTICKLKIGNVNKFGMTNNMYTQKHKNWQFGLFKWSKPAFQKKSIMHFLSCKIDNGK